MSRALHGKRNPGPFNRRRPSPASRGRRSRDARTSRQSRSLQLGSGDGDFCSAAERERRSPKDGPNTPASDKSAQLARQQPRLATSDRKPEAMSDRRQPPPLGYQQRPHRERDTAGSARHFRSRRQRTARSAATGALSQSVAPPSEATVARSGRALAQGLLDPGVQQTPPPVRTTRSDSHRSPRQTDEFAWQHPRRAAAPGDSLVAIAIARPAPP